MGSGQGCDAQYLFSEDILGYNRGHIPRHSKVYTNLSEDYEKIKKKSIEAYKAVSYTHLTLPTIYSV